MQYSLYFSQIHSFILKEIISQFLSTSVKRMLLVSYSLKNKHASLFNFLLYFLTDCELIMRVFELFRYLKVKNFGEV